MSSYISNKKPHVIARTLGGEVHYWTGDYAGAVKVFTTNLNAARIFDGEQHARKNRSLGEETVKIKRNAVDKP